MKTTPFYVLASICLLLLLLTAAPTAVLAQHWTYSNTDAWRNMFPMCATEMQAPISIAETTPRQGEDMFLKITPIAGSGPFQVVTIVQSHSLYVDLRVLQMRLVSSVTPLHEYALRSMVLKSPCEHVVPGISCTVEVQYEFEPVDVGVTDSNDRVVLVHQYYESSDNAVESAPLLVTLNEASRGISSSTDSATTSVTPLVQELVTDSVFTYAGSRNTPPCTQGVKYFVNANQRHASAGLLQNLRDHAKLLSASGSARPVQSVDGRAVVRRRVFTSAPRAEFFTLLQLTASGTYQTSTLTPPQRNNPLNDRLQAAVVAMAAICGLLVAGGFMWLLVKMHVIVLPAWMGGMEPPREKWVNPVDGQNTFGAVTQAPSAEEEEEEEENEDGEEEEEGEDDE
eukprot:PhM_4_TR5041/c0_g1_i1/m.76690/K01674/cah; carbonic anhydrase